MYSETELNPPQEVGSTPEEKLELVDHKLTKILTSSGRTSHKNQTTVGKGGKCIVSFIEKSDNTCKGSFGGKGRLFPTLILT